MLVLNICLTFLVALSIQGSLSFSMLGMPLHASCKIDWTWSIPCSQVEASIVEQIGKWNNTNCNENEKCRYALQERTDTRVTALHTTPVKFYVDDLTFTFSQTASQCQVKGNSRSETWYAVLDYGTNYCNLHNLITGSGLDKMAGYKETTSNSVCTQYSSANCDKY